MIDTARQQVWATLEKKVQYKALTKNQAEIQISNLRGQLTYDNFQHADIVIEAVLEVMDLKKRIIKDIEAHCKPDVIIATNTSSLSVTEMAGHASRPEMVIGMHYFSPVPKMPLLEIVRTNQTDRAGHQHLLSIGHPPGQDLYRGSGWPRLLRQSHFSTILQ